MAEKINEVHTMSREDSIFHIAFAWLAALATTIAAWLGLS